MDTHASEAQPPRLERQASALEQRVADGSYVALAQALAERFLEYLEQLTQPS